MTTTTGKHVRAVRDKLRDRARTGLRKYGVTTERQDLSTIEWLSHLQQEVMDAAVYTERTMEDVAKLTKENAELRAALIKHNCGTPGCVCYALCREADDLPNSAKAATHENNDDLD